MTQSKKTTQPEKLFRVIAQNFVGPKTHAAILKAEANGEYFWGDGRSAPKTGTLS